MRTREESLNKFCEEIDTLINSKYLFASSGVFNIITAINSSKLLTDIFEYFVSGFDFEKTLTSSLIDDNGLKIFVLPKNNYEAISLIYLLLKEINFKHLQLTDLLDYFDGGKNYEIAYKNFAKEVLLPFKNYVYSIGLQVINSTQSEDEASYSQSKVKEEPISNNNNNKKESVEGIEKINIVKTQNVEGVDNITLLRLIDLDNLAINQSKINKDDKAELLYVLKIFEGYVRENDDEKIKLSYLAYYYAMRTFTKIKSNLKDITHILIERKII